MLQIAANIVEPFGEPRADERAAWNTIKQINHEGDKTLGDIHEFLTNYTGQNDTDSGALKADPDALEKIKGRTSE